MSREFIDKEGDTFILEEILPNGDWAGHWDFGGTLTGSIVLNKHYVNTMVECQPEIKLRYTFYRRPQ